MHETDALAESVADMRETLDLVRNLLAGVREEHPALARIGDGIGARLATDARTDGSALGPLAWEPRSTQLRDGIDDVLRALDAADATASPDEVRTQARAAIH